MKKQFLLIEESIHPYVTLKITVKMQNVMKKQSKKEQSLVPKI